MTRVIFVGVFTLAENWLRPDTPISWRETTVVGWSGMRGIVSLVASLALPFTTEGSVFPYRDLILFLAFVLILFTLVIQVPMLPLLVRRMGIMGNMRSGEEAIARTATAQAALDQIDRIQVAGLLPESEVERLRLEFTDRLRAAQTGDEDHNISHLQTPDLHMTRARIIECERTAVLALRRSRQVGDEVLQKTDPRAGSGRGRALFTTNRLQFLVDAASAATILG